MTKKTAAKKTTRKRKADQVATVKRPVGAPQQHDREALRAKFFAYIEETAIPIVSEFAYTNGLHRQQLYEIPELSDAIRLCITKKETALEKKGLSGEVNTTMAVFSLKQLGWTDGKSEQQNSEAAPTAVKITIEDARK